MTSKSFRLAAAAISLSASLLATAGTTLRAQHPIATPTVSGTPRPKGGNIRFWNMTPATSGIILELVAGNFPEARALINSSPSNYFVNYTSVPVGSYAFKVFRAGNRQQPIKSFDLAMKDRSYYTLFATQDANGQIAIEFIDDTPDPTKPPKNRLTIRQFCQDMTVTVAVTGNLKADALPYGKTTTLEPASEGVTSINVRATKAGSPAVKSWETQADFHLSHRYTLFIINDLYGRMRARVATDGPSPEEEAAAAAEAAHNQPR